MPEEASATSGSSVGGAIPEAAQVAIWDLGAGRCTTKSLTSESYKASEAKQTWLGFLLGMLLSYMCPRWDGKNGWKSFSLEHHHRGLRRMCTVGPITKLVHKPSWLAFLIALPSLQPARGPGVL